jgi:hypothetical protein
MYSQHKTSLEWRLISCRLIFRNKFQFHRIIISQKFHWTVVAKSWGTSFMILLVNLSPRTICHRFIVGHSNFFVIVFGFTRFLNHSFGYRFNYSCSHTMIIYFFKLFFITALTSTLLFGYILITSISNSFTGSFPISIKTFYFLIVASFLSNLYNGYFLSL